MTIYFQAASKRRGNPWPLSNFLNNMNMFLKQLSQSVQNLVESNCSKVNYLKRLFNVHAHKLHFQPQWPNLIVGITGIQVGKQEGKRYVFLSDISLE